MTKVEAAKLKKLCGIDGTFNNEFQCIDLIVLDKIIDELTDNHSRDVRGVLDEEDDL